ncbi:MAG: prepilin-type N-terminal cleavage/methylation domain-containing protein [Chthoniobacterales bacterium]|nr:prepilin-type N-terminal cleavage/methylation domain-containing protein [Chthoniobacterales bacterium]
MKPAMNSSCSRQCYHAAFSLVELLATVAVLSLLATLVIPSLGGTNSNKITSGGNQLAETLTLARQNSLSRRTYTSLVVKVTGEGARSAYCLVEYARADDGTFTAATPLTPWRRLPTGIYFMNAASNNFLAAATSPVDAPLSDLVYQGQALDPANDLIAQTFQPDGLLTTGQLLRLRVAEGVIDGSGTVTMKNPGSDDQPKNYYDIVVLRDTGLTKIERL